MKNVIGFIPSRSGSKRLKDKNIKLLNNKPLIAYTIEAAKQSKKLSRIICSTNSKIHADIAQSFGAEVPFLRPEELAVDKTSDREVLLHFINWVKENEKTTPDYIVLLRPTTPFKNGELIDNCISAIEDSDFSSIRTVTKVAGVFHPYWMYKKEDKRLEPFIKGIEISKYYQSQMLPTCYRLNGVVDILKTENIIRSENMYGNNIGSIEVEAEKTVDIDDLSDFKFAEFLLKESLIK